MRQTFTLSWDRTTKVVTTLVCALLFAVALFQGGLWTAVLPVAVVLVGFAYSPRGYIVTDHRLTVSRFIGSVVVPLNELLEAHRATGNDLSGCIRLWGSGGMFGYYGLFRTSALGTCTWYVTNRDNAVVLVTASKTVLVSPDDIDEFLLAVGPARDAHGAPRFPVDQSGSRIGLALGLGVAVLVGALMLYSPGKPRATLTAESLTIEDRFYPVTIEARSVDTPNIRVVDLTTDREWKPAMRTNGFANPRYQSGWYQVAGGKKVRLYRAGGRRVVLLPPKSGGTPVLLDASDPDTLARAIQTAWR